MHDEKGHFKEEELFCSIETEGVEGNLFEYKLLPQAKKDFIDLLKIDEKKLPEKKKEEYRKLRFSLLNSKINIYRAKKIEIKPLFDEEEYNDKH